jgi:hypothetical protein
MTKKVGDGISKEVEVERIIRDVRSEQKSPIYRSCNHGWVAPTAQGKETLARYIKEIRKENGLPESLFDDVEAVIHDYCGYEEYSGDNERGGYRPSIRHGEGVFIDKGQDPISWHFNNEAQNAGKRNLTINKDSLTQDISEFERDLDEFIDDIENYSDPNYHPNWL